MRLLLLTAALAALAAPAAFSDDASKNAKIEEMFRITKVDQLQTQIMEQMKGVLGNMFNQPGVPEEVKTRRKDLEDQVFDLVLKRVSWDKMKPEFLKVYTEVLTEEEIDSILAFYKTPGGQALLQKMPELMKRGMEIGQAQMKDVIPEMQQLVEKFMSRRPPPKEK